MQQFREDDGRDRQTIGLAIETIPQLRGAMPQNPDTKVRVEQEAKH
jgi:hypothetical protein